MKTFFISFLLLFFSLACNAQLNFGLGTQVVIDNIVFGTQARAMYEVQENWRVSGTFTYHFDREFDWTIDSDVQYKLITLGDDTHLAPLLGFDINNGALRGIDIGANLGVFADFLIENFRIYVEPKFVLKKQSTFVISGGFFF